MEKYVISEEYLEEVTTIWAKGLVGQVMKRFEILAQKDDIKKEVKELIYENIRDLKSLLKAFSSGVTFIMPKTKNE